MRTSCTRMDTKFSFVMLMFSIEAYSELSCLTLTILLCITCEHQAQEWKRRSLLWCSCSIFVMVMFPLVTSGVGYGTIVLHACHIAFWCLIVFGAVRHRSRTSPSVGSPIYFRFCTCGGHTVRQSHHGLSVSYLIVSRKSRHEASGCNSCCPAAECAVFMASWLAMNRREIFG